MNQQLSVLIPEGTIAVFLVVAFILVLAANIYDIRLSLRRKSFRKVQSKFRRSHKPAISILVYARNNAVAVIKCLESIRRNRYPHCDIVVVDDLSTDDTRLVVRSYMQKHPLFSVRIYSKRKHSNKSEALERGYHRSQKGELVMVIDATSVISPTFIRDSAARFWRDKKLNILHFNINNQDSGSITLLYYRFLRLSRSMLDKFYTLVSEYRVGTDLSGSMYRPLAFRDACKSFPAVGRYDSDLVVVDSFVNNDKTALAYQFSKDNHSIYYLVFALVMVSLQTYSMYIAATLQSKLILTVGWLAMAFWLLLVTWSSRATTIKDKVALSFCAPFVYFLLYVQLIMYVIFITATLIKSLLKQAAHEFVIGAMAR